MSVPAYRPLTTGQILERVYRLLRANWKLLFGIGALPGISFFVSFGMLLAAGGYVAFAVIRDGKQASQAQIAIPLVAAYCLMMVIQLVVLSLYLSAASYAAVSLDCGSRVTMRESYAVARERAGRSVLLMLAIYAICFLPSILLQAPMFAIMAFMGATQTNPSPILIILFPIVFVLSFGTTIAGLLVGLRLVLAFPVSMFENLTVKQALKRSWRLTRGALGRIFLVILVVYGVIYVVVMVFMMLAFALGAIGYLVFSPALAHPTTQTIWFLAICGGIAYLALMAVLIACSWAGYSTAFSVLYNDQRMRFDPLPAGISPGGGTQ
jgi:hypothetical protein